MKKTIFIWLAVFIFLIILGSVLVLAGIFKPAVRSAYDNSEINSQLPISNENEKGPQLSVSDPLKSLKNLPYTIDGETIVLQDGTASTVKALGDGSATITNYFGNEAQGDINGDGRDDYAFLLEQSPAGSGNFYYLAAVLNGENSLQVLNTVFLGDRIAPQSTEIKNGEIIVSYADRKPGEPMSTAPSVGVSNYFKLADGQLVKISNE